jgi:hypothetical protein
VENSVRCPNHEFLLDQHRYQSALQQQTGSHGWTRKEQEEPGDVPITEEDDGALVNDDDGDFDDSDDREE